MTNNYNESAAEVANAMNAVYENKTTNKKNDISGDFSSDNISYPTVKAVKDQYEGNGTAKNAHVHGNLTTDGKIGDNISADKLVVTGNGGALAVVQTIDADHITDDTAYTNIGSSANSNQSAINSAIDTALANANTNLAIDVIQQQTPETGFAATYYITQGGTQVGAKINIFKDKMVRSVSVETVGATLTSEETAYNTSNNGNLSTGDQYIKWVVNTVDNDGATSLILPITSIFDLQTADNTTLVLSNGVYSIKNSGVDTAQLKDSSVTYAKLNNATINTLESTMDTKISDFASALANAINPSS